MTSKETDDKEKIDRQLMPPPPSSSSSAQAHVFSVIDSAKETSEFIDTNTRYPDTNPLNQFPMLGGPQRAVSGIGIARQKKPLAPGHSPLDWAQLKQSSVNLAGVSQLKRYNADEIKVHNKKDDLWMVYNGKVYNVTKYMDFHPGGAGQLMRGAGKDATELINKVSWNNE